MGQPQNNQGKKQDENSQQQNQPRDTRKELGQQNKQKRDNQGKPENGEKSPQDPADRLNKGRKQDDPNAEPPRRDDDTPAWVTALPPEIRSALETGRGEEIPAKFQDIVRRYNLYLQKKRRSGSGR